MQSSATNVNPSATESECVRRVMVLFLWFLSRWRRSEACAACKSVLSASKKGGGGRDRVGRRSPDRIARADQIFVHALGARLERMTHRMEAFFGRPPAGPAEKRGEEPFDLLGLMEPNSTGRQ